MDIIPIFKDIKNCIAFLTRIPINTKIDIPKQLAPKMWLFPIVGFLIGLIISLLGLFLFQILPSLLVGFILLSILLFLTGAHHLDGLLDFGDGLMVIGSPEHKIEVMHDVSIGAGGFSLGLMVLSLTGLAMGYLTNYLIIAFISCEVISKFNMVAACSVGKSAGTQMAEPFIRVNKKKHMIFAGLLSIFLILLSIFLHEIFYNLYNSIPALELIFFPINPFFIIDLFQIILIILLFSFGAAMPLFILMRLSHKHFKGLTGDCLGALNEITRLFVLILFVCFQEILAL